MMIDIEKAIQLMLCGADYEDRFKGEYYYLICNLNQLGFALNGIEKGVCKVDTKSYELLKSQYEVVSKHIEILEERAKIESIDLTVKE